MTTSSIKDLDPKNVCNDMLARLQAQVPALAATAAPAAVDPSMVPTVGLKELEERIKELQKKVDVKLTEDSKPKSEREAAEAISRQLQEIVDMFNDELTKWYDKTGCVANFGWSYAGGKKLEITAIDYIVYRKAPPSEKSIKEVLDKAVTK